MELGLNQEPAGSQAGERPWRGQSWLWAVGTAESSLTAGGGGGSGRVGEEGSRLRGLSRGLNPRLLKSPCCDFPGGAAVKNPPSNAGDVGSIPGPGGSHVPQGN